MNTIDLNCDIGENAGNDEGLLPFISSANIACGYHAGDRDMMIATVQRCAKYNIAVGAHPSFSDRVNFGRTEMNLSAQDLYQLVFQQLAIFSAIVREQDLQFHHVKPHGALYNMAARDPLIAATIATAVKDFDPALVLYGLAGSYAILEAAKLGLKTAAEGFADRSYQDNGSLTSRADPHAMIEHTGQALAQVVQMITENRVRSVNGKKIPIHPETICIHGDGPGAVDFAKAIYYHLKKERIEIKAIQ